LSICERLAAIDASKPGTVITTQKTSISSDMRRIFGARQHPVGGFEQISRVSGEFACEFAFEPVSHSLLEDRSLSLRKHQIAECDEHVEAHIKRERAGVPSGRETPDRWAHERVRRIQTAGSLLELMHCCLKTVL